MINEKKKLGINNLTFLLLCFFIVIFEVPVIAARIHNVTILAMVFFYLLSINRKTLAVQSRTLFWIAVFIGMELLYKIIGLSDNSFFSYSLTAKFFLCLIIMLPIYNRLTQRESDFILVFSFLSVFVSIVYNIYLYYRLGSQYNVRLFQSEYGVANTQYVSSILFVTGIVFVALMRERKSIRKIFLFLFLALCVFFQFVVAQRGIVLLLLIVMLPLLFLLGTKRRNSSVFIVIGSIIILVILILQYENIITWLISKTSSARLAARFQQSLIFLQTGNVEEAGGSLYARFRLTMNSIHTFTSSIPHFLVGVGDRRSNNVTVGNHSLFIDTLARYGILGGFVVFNLIRACRDKINEISMLHKKSELYRQLQVLIMMFIIRGFLGEIFDPAIGVQMFIVIPLMMRKYSDESEVA